MDGQLIPAVTLKRLPRYHRYLRELICVGERRINSAALSRMMGVSASQIRQDFSYFGGFGQQGYGYNVKYVYGKICELLGVTDMFTAVVVGMDNLGRAFADDKIFEKHGVELRALFDASPDIIGSEIAGFTVLCAADMESYCRDNKIDIAVLTVPRRDAVDYVKRLCSAGVAGIWNFTDCEIKVGVDIPKTKTAVHTLHLSDMFLNLCYDVKQIKAAEKAENKEMKGGGSLI